MSLRPACHSSMAIPLATLLGNSSAGVLIRLEAAPACHVPTDVEWTALRPAIDTFMLRKTYADDAHYMFTVAIASVPRQDERALLTQRDRVAKWFIFQHTDQEIVLFFLRHDGIYVHLSMDKWFEDYTWDDGLGRLVYMQDFVHFYKELYPPDREQICSLY